MARPDFRISTDSESLTSMTYLPAGSRIGRALGYRKSSNTGGAPADGRITTHVFLSGSISIVFGSWASGLSSVSSGASRGVRSVSGGGNCGAVSAVPVSIFASKSASLFESRATGEMTFAGRTSIPSIFVTAGCGGASSKPATEIGSASFSAGGGVAGSTGAGAAGPGVAEAPQRA